MDNMTKEEKLSEREKHLAWCKERALQYLEEGDIDINSAWASMVSDMEKNPLTKDHPLIDLGTTLFLAGQLDSTEKMRKFIEDFN